jgi:hypothetical protein
MTPLDKPLRRAIIVDGTEYTLLIDPDGLRLTQKGRRNGVSVGWKDLVSGDAALAKALQASVADEPGAG